MRQVVKQSGQLVAIIGPGVLWIIFFLVLPSLYLMSIAFLSNDPYGLPQLPLSLQSFRELAGFGILGWSPGNLFTLGRSLWQATFSTVLVILISYPIAYYIATRPVHLRPLMLVLIVVPSWTNQVIRAVGWMNLFAPGTPLANFSAMLGFTTPQMGLFPSQFAVVVGMVYNFLPFMVLPLYAAFERLDRAQVEAARDLFATPTRAFFHAVLPQTLPGLLAGTVLVAVPAFGMFVVPELLGGGRSSMIGNLVARQFADGANWPLGAAGALLMILATLFGLYVLRRAARRLSSEREMLL
ncbi:MAG: ABC transporter permease [Gammaproteobacteria bacterium]|nr:ABC transporter permease [Gammaproteobacteria bacterium]